MQDEVEALLHDERLEEFNALREHEVKIVAIVRSQSNSEGEHIRGGGDILQLKKLSPLHRVLVTAHYVLQVDYYGWEHELEGPIRTASIHRCLMSIEASQGEGGVKLGTRKPDVLEYSKTLSRFGAVNDALIDFKNIFNSGAKQFVALLPGQGVDSEEGAYGDEMEPEMEPETVGAE